jgi:hypothetical protein
MGVSGRRRGFDARSLDRHVALRSREIWLQDWDRGMARAEPVTHR